MKVYDCKVRNKGDVRDEVVRKAITAAEIKVLRHIHGDDAVVGIKPLTAEAERTEEVERERLEMRYGAKAIAEVFGVKIAKIAEEFPEELPEEVKLPVGKRTTRVPNKTEVDIAQMTE